MTEVSSAPPTAASAESPKSTLPPVECAPWCRAQDGHPGETHIDDQWCGSESARIMLSAENPVRYHDGTYGLGDLEVYAGHEAYSTRPLVHIAHNQPGAINLTRDEARQLAQALLSLVERTGE